MFNGLSQIVESQNIELTNPKILHLFIGKRRSKIKILYFHKDGLCLWQKKLEVGTFKIKDENKIYEIDKKEFYLLLNGIELTRILFRKKVKKL